MADDIIQRRMSAEEEANLHQQIQDFSHTIRRSSDQSAGSELIDQGIRGKIPTGDEIRSQLMRRAEESQHLDSTLGVGSQFFDYKRSSVGGIGKDKEIHRQLSQLSRQERKKREMRFGHHKRPVPSRHKKVDAPDRRQAFNATGDAKEANYEPGSRQGFNVGPDNSGGMSNLTFREPTPRGYDPFA